MWQRFAPRLLLAALALLIVAMAAIFVQTSRAERESRAQRLTAMQNLIELRNITRIGIDAETGQRGYMLTDDESFLEPYEAARTTWLRDLEKFRTKDLHKDQLAELYELAAAKLEELQRTIDLARAGRDEEAAALMLTGEGKMLMDRFRRIALEIEQDQLAQVQNDTVEIEKQQLAASIAMALLMGGVVALGYFAFMQERRGSRAALLDAEAAMLREKQEQSELLAHEMNHRVKNLFAVILSLVSMSEKGSENSKETIEKIRKRIYALSTAHSIGQGKGNIDIVGLKDIMDVTLAPYRRSAGNVVIDGPNILLPSTVITPLGLLVHELATNALKYGALSADTGVLNVHWHVEDATGNGGQDVVLTWTETGGPAPVNGGGKGFGSTLIEAAGMQLMGKVEQEWLPEGLKLTLRFPAERR